MTSDAPLDYAVFQLSPRRSRCELFVSYDGTTEMLASGFVKPFVTHLKFAEEQVALAVKSIKLEVDRYKNAETWFTKGTLERFVQYVGTPEVLEMVNTFDAEMSQLEAARRIYSQGSGDDQSSASGGDGGASAASDATKKELLRAIDVRLSAVREDLTTACNRASAAGYNPETISELQFFADRFGAHRLSEACSKFINLSQRRADLFNNYQSTSSWKSSSEHALRSSSSSDMSLDEPSDDQPKHSTSKVTFPLRRFSREPSPSPIADGEEREKVKDKNIEKDKLVPTTSACNSTTESDQSPSSTSTKTPQLTRRLSVQERISMFENKVQKDSSPTITTAASSGVKPELRRLSSDVTSSTDKAVLRRWSGASDMSIDVSGERKEPDSNANTPTATSACTSTPRPVFPPKFKDQSDLKSEEGVKESKLPVRPKVGSHLPVFSNSGRGYGLEESTTSEANSKIASFSGRSSENVDLKDQLGGEAALSSAVPLGLESQPSYSIQTQFSSRSAKIEQFGTTDQTTTEEKVKSSLREGSKSQEDIEKNFGASSGFDRRSSGLLGEGEEYRERDKRISKSTYRTSQKRTVEAVPESAFEVHSQPISQNNRCEEVVQAERPDSESLEKQAESLLKQMENSGLYRGKYQGHDSSFDQARKLGARREEGGSRSQQGFTAKNVPENQELFSPTSSMPVEQVQRVKQSKVNLGMNDDLKLKANELEKLFAEHKLRAPGDVPNSARRTRPADMTMEQQMGSVDKKSVPEAEPAAGSTYEEKNDSTPLTKATDYQEYDVTPKQNTYSLGYSDDSRGRSYQKYMQKRDAKLKEDWSSRRAEKEANMKAMQDSLEKSRAEMKFKLAGSADKRSSVQDARRRAEKLRSFSARSTVKREQPTDSFISDEDEDQAEFLGKKLSDAYMADIPSRSAQNKKGIPSKSTASSMPRNSGASISRSSGKVSNSSAGRRRLPYDNPLAQSVPNFSDLRKENTKPSPAGSKVVRAQGRNHARKKSVTEDVPFVGEEKARRSHSLKKSTANSIELNESRNSDDVDEDVFTPSKHGKDENEGYHTFSKDIEPKHFQKKSNGVGYVTGTNRFKATTMGEALGNGHDLDDASFETEEMTDVAKDDDDDFETIGGEESVNLENNKGRLSQESDKSANSVYENSNALGSLSQDGPALATGLPASMSSLFRSIGSIQDSPGESPGSWNSRANNPFSFTHEVSDIYASDSPNGSPASWNFHSLMQTDAEARMRKKWGAAQKPTVGDSSPSMSRKDVTKGLKRFLKFGRKNRATESMADWISATTSEGDDDTEDGRDLANRSSEDLRKSRMGFSHSHHCDEGFNESDLFNDQVHTLQSSIPTPSANFKFREEPLSGSSLKAPKSFFSLSNFRSKGSDSKPR